MVVTLTPSCTYEKNIWRLENWICHHGVPHNIALAHMTFHMQEKCLFRARPLCFEAHWRFEKNKNSPPPKKKKKGRKTKNRKTWQSRSKTFQRDEQDTEVPMRLTCSKNQKETKGNNGSGVSRRRGLGQQKWLRNEFGTKGSGQIKWRLQILIRNVDFIIPSHYMRFVLVHSTAFSVPTSFHGIKFSNYLI